MQPVRSPGRDDDHEDGELPIEDDIRAAKIPRRVNAWPGSALPDPTPPPPPVAAGGYHRGFGAGRGQGDISDHSRYHFKYATYA